MVDSGTSVAAAVDDQLVRNDIDTPTALDVTDQYW
jgi:hypothetical protein